MSRSIYRVVAVLVIVSGCGGQASSKEAAQAGKVGKEAVPAEAPKRAEQDRASAFLAALQLEDPAAAEKSFTLIKDALENKRRSEQFRREQAGEKSPQLLRDMKKATGGEISEEHALVLADTLAGDGAASAKVRDARHTLQDAMVLAAHTVQQAEPGLSEYETRTRVFAAARAAWPETHVYFRPNPILGAIEGLEPPAVDAKYKPLMDVSQEYWEHDLYKELVATLPDEMPEGALIPLLYLGGLPVPAYLRREALITEPSELLKRYGERACRAIAHCLSNPEECRRTFDEPPYRELYPLQVCPGDFKRKVFQAALSSGWMAVESYLPGHEPWADALLDEFEGGPYGSPQRWPQRRPLTESEQKMLDERLQKVFTRYDAEKTGQYHPDRVLRQKLEKEFAFENKKLQSELVRRLTEHI